MKKYTFSVPRKWKRLLVKYKKADLINAKMWNGDWKRRVEAVVEVKTERQIDRQTDR